MASLLILSGCSSSNKVTFTITIKNVSGPNTLTTNNTGVVISGGVVTIHKENTKVIFTNGAAASAGLEKLAEEGAATDLNDELKDNSDVSETKTFGAVEPGKEVTVTIDAEPGDALSLAAMFVQSNDLFFAPNDTGIVLFNGETASTINNASIKTWDAGTEDNEALGSGTGQPPGDATGGTPTANGTVSEFTDGNNEVTGTVIEVSIVPESTE